MAKLINNKIRVLGKSFEVQKYPLFLPSNRGYFGLSLSMPTALHMTVCTFVFVIYVICFRGTGTYIRPASFAGRASLV